jgi:hypothetical protein
VVVDGVEVDREMVRFRVRARSGDAACSCCGQRSSRVHARYQRRLADLPIGGRRAEIAVHVRRFKCVNELCPSVTFSEQISGLTTAFVRRTPSLTAALVRLALALAGRPGSRLAARLSMHCSRDMLIRLIRAQPLPEVGRIAVLGVDLSRCCGYADSGGSPQVGRLLSADES